jgi:hypothetical protein
MVFGSRFLFRMRTPSAPLTSLPSPLFSSQCTICCATSLTLAERRERLAAACQHAERTVCEACIRQHIRAEVRGKGAATQLACPQAGCGARLEHLEVQRWAVAADFEVYDTLVLRRALQAMAEFRWCAHPGCGSGQLHESGADAPILRCRACGGRSCFTHRVVWHEGRTCADYEADAGRSEEVALVQALDGVVRCPGCSQGVEKKGGCDHMTCRCGHEFCWRCLAAYRGDKGIFAVGNRAHRPSCQYYM